jgi:DNA (cytosine-5)-methyltransferase 1
MLAVDFFCGAGGTTCGLLAAGIDVIIGLDIDSTAKTTYEQNRRPNGRKCKFLNKSVVDFRVGDIGIAGAHRGNNPLLFAACPPCQPFTNLKTDKSGQEGSSRLLLKFLEAVRLALPEYVLMENVPGIRQAKYGAVFDDFVTGLIGLGYNVDYGVLNAKDYGVPQSRRRMILVASTLGDVTLPTQTHGPRRELQHVGAAAAFRFPPIVAGSRHATVPNHQSSGLSDINQRRIRSITTAGGSRNLWEDNLQLECYRNHTGHTDVYGRINPAAPAPTLTTRFNSLSNGRFGHPTEHRAISLREGAALQTFPDEYTFKATAQNVVARHIGNAVPVQLAATIGSTLLAHYAAWRCGAGVVAIAIGTN